jgi:ribosomal protein S18 acetylase RimI-like enzyme
MDMSYMTEKVLRNRAVKNAVDYNSSVGVYDGEEMVGFTLIGIDTWKGAKSAFDAGTGVIKEYRGNGLARQMFDFSLPRLLGYGVEKFILEVIQDNEPAIKAYKKAGFQVVRELDCYELELEDPFFEVNSEEPFQILPVGKEILRDFRDSLDWEPSWENSFSAIDRIRDEVILYGAKGDGEFIGLLVYYPLLNWILSLVVKEPHRRKGVASNLLSRFVRDFSPGLKKTKLLNVDHSDSGMKTFLSSSLRWRCPSPLKTFRHVLDCAISYLKS